MVVDRRGCEKHRILGSDHIPLAANSDIYRAQASRHFSKEQCLSEEKKMIQVARSKKVFILLEMYVSNLAYKVG